MESDRRQDVSRLLVALLCADGVLHVENDVPGRSQTRWGQSWWRVHRDNCHFSVRSWRGEGNVHMRLTFTERKMFRLRA
jgi:hypothetical protein